MIEIDFAAWAVLIGAALPLAISAVKQAEWSSNTKKMVSLGISAVVGVIYTGADLGWDPASWNELWTTGVASIGAIWGAAQIAYLGIWEGQKIEARIAAFGYRKAA